MLVSVSDVQLGMDVLSQDEKKLGRINEIINNPRPAESEGRDSPSTVDHLYMQVAEGDLLEFWRPSLYIPLSAIATVVAGQHVVLTCTESEAKERWADKPSFLQ